jgi:hypothetical protein
VKYWCFFVFILANFLYGSYYRVLVFAPAPHLLDCFAKLLRDIWVLTVVHGVSFGFLVPNKKGQALTYPFNINSFGVEVNC